MAKDKRSVKIVKDSGYIEERRLIDVSCIPEDIALHYFGNLNNIVTLPEVMLPGIGIINYLLVRHKLGKAEVDDFVVIRFQPDFVESHDLQVRAYTPNININNTIKYLMIEAINQEIICQAWNTKCYWIVQEYIYSNFIKAHGLKEEGFVPEHASRFALYDFVNIDTRLTLSLSRFASTTVGESYPARQPDAGIPDKDKFVQMLNTKLRNAIYNSFKAALAKRLQHQGEIHG